MDKAVMSARMQKWAGIIQEAATCGMTKTEFCARKGIDRRQFFHWQKVIADRRLSRTAKTYFPLSGNCVLPVRFHGRTAASFWKNITCFYLSLTNYVMIEKMREDRCSSLPAIISGMLIFSYSCFSCSVKKHNNM